MEKILAKWESLSASSGIVRFLDINLRSIGQVMLQNNPLTGLLFLAAIAWGSYAAGVPRVAIAGVLAVVVANLTAQWLNADSESLHAGLYGYNGVLVGLALATFLSPNALMWVYVVLGASVSVIAMLGTVNALKPWGVSSLTFPFVLTTWLLLLATYGFSGLVGAALPAGDVVIAFQPYEASPLKLIDLLQGVLQSISQVFLKANGVAALLLLAGLAVNSLDCRRIRSRRRDTGSSDGPSFRRRKRADHRRSSRFQPGSDGDRARCRVLPAELAGRDLRHAGHAVYGHRTSSAERCLGAARHPCAYRTFCARHMDLPSSTPVFRASVGCNGRCRDSAHNLDLCFFGSPHV